MASGWGVDRDAASGGSTPAQIDHGGLSGLSDDDHSQYLLASAATSRAAFAANWTDLTDGGGTTLHTHTLDHGAALTGLSDDDHTQYALLAGRSGGQTLYGGTAASENLTLASTSHGTKGAVILSPAGGDVQIGGGATASLLKFMEPSGSGSNYSAFKAQAQAGNVTYILPSADATVSGYALKSDGAGNLSWGQAGGADLKQTITQSTHGFAVGDWLYHNGTIYAKAKADAASTADCIGVVAAVTDSNTFQLQQAGYISVLSGLTAGTAYFLSASTAGAITATEPSTVGQISKPLLIADTTTSGWVIATRRGITVGNASSSFAVSQASGDGSTTAFTLPAAPVHENNVFVTISGVAQHKDTFSVSGSTLTFSTAPPTGTSNIEFCVVGSVSIGTPSDGTVTNAKMAAGALFTLSSEQASTSGTAIDFTGIPSGTQMIVVMFDGVGTNASASIGVQIGDSGGIENTGYVGASGYYQNAGANGVTATETTFWYAGVEAGNADNVVHGLITLTLQDSANNTWVMSGVLNATGTTPYASHVSGKKALSAVLDRVRIIPTTTGTFNAGAISILYR